MYNVSEIAETDCEVAIGYDQSEGTTQYGPGFSGRTYKSRAKWKMLWGIYSAIYGDVNVPVEKCVEIKGDYVEK